MRVVSEGASSLMVERKKFRFKAILEGTKVEIEETNKVNSSSLALPLGVVAWLRDTLAVLIRICSEGELGSNFSEGGERLMLYGGFKEFQIGGGCVAFWPWICLKAEGVTCSFLRVKVARVG